MKAFVFPGQGSQFVGMGKDLYDNNPLAKELFDKADEILGFKITEIMFAGTDEQLKETKVTQPAVFLHSVISALCLGDEFKPDMVAGHSLGEFSALVAAGALSFEDGLKLVAARANAMQKACELNPGTMAAIIGLPDEKVEEICASVSQEGKVCVAANFNCPGQLVISGSIEGINEACELMKAAGAKRALPLKVGGAFHSPLMQPAKDELQAAIEATTFNAPKCPVYQNVDALPHTDPAEIQKNLIAQLTSSVRWTKSAQNMIADGATEFIECGPGSALQGMLGRIDKTVNAHGVQSYIIIKRITPLPSSSLNQGGDEGGGFLSFICMKTKLVIYQVFTRTFGNKNLTKKEYGTLAENGAGKMNDFDKDVLRRIHDLGVTHLWYTGVIRHATCTDYSSFGIPTQNPRVVKGRAGSPYAITDYYDIDPDIAVDVDARMAEFESLVARTHAEGMKIIIDFVPNHVARQYKSIAKPKGVEDLGEGDDTGKHFDPQNNFYYCPGEQLDLSGVVENTYAHRAEAYHEFPAKCTGNDRFDSHPQQNDWYETIKLNYGVDYCDAGGRSYHYHPVPSTWKKMTDILLFWAAKGVDGFRCDMAEMVPHEFWAYATQQVKERYPEMIFIGEVYDPNQYRMYVESGFDYLYDKVGMYDCIRGVICGERSASSITHEWQKVDDIRDHMLYFLENHDEQRIASDFFAGNPWKGVPGMIVSALLQQNPVMIYAGQEFGEKGMDKEGFSGQDGRSTIFDYWTSDTVYKGFFNRDALTTDEKKLSLIYQGLLRFCNREKAVREGLTFDLMYVNQQSHQFNPHKQFVFLRKADDEVLLVVANFDQERVQINVTIPAHAFDFLGIPEQEVEMTDLLSGFAKVVDLKRDGQVALDVEANYGRIYKFNIKKQAVDYVLNSHNKEEFPPAHTAEHLLNQVMIRMFGTERSNNAHIERKKSKMTFILDHKPDRKEEKAIEDEMNRLIAEDLPVTFEMVDRNNIPEGVTVDRLPEDASEMLRLVRIGDFDVCLCIGKHVRSTAQIGRFEMLGTNWDEQKRAFRVRFKVIPA